MKFKVYFFKKPKKLQMMLSHKLEVYVDKQNF